MGLVGLSKESILFNCTTIVAIYFNDERSVQQHMKNKKFKKYPLVVIEWYDHAGEGGWVEIKDLEEEPILAKTVGYLENLFNVLFYFFVFYAMQLLLFLSFLSYLEKHL